MELDNGFIYIMKNEAMPGIYKIGLTRRSSVENRAAELSSTSVPFDFEVLNYWGSDYCGQLERFIHNRFKELRLNKGREFFRFSCDHNAMEQLAAAVESFVPDKTPKKDNATNVIPRGRMNETASKRAKALGAKSLNQVAEAYGCTPTNLDYMHRTKPERFEIVVLGVVAKLELIKE